VHEITRFELDNQLAVAVVALPHLHTATLALYVRVGSRYESAADNGLSHFVEHMLFRGTERYPSSYELNFAIEQLGSGLHAETGRQDSMFQLAARAADLDAGLELLGEIFGRPRFADIELERALILEEMSEDYDSHGVEINVDDIARGLMFDGHPLAQRVIGPRSNVERFTQDDVRAHFARFYGARNMILCVAGPVAPDAVEAAARRHLAALPEGQATTAEAAPQGPEDVLFRHVRDRGSQAELSMIVRAVPELDDDYTACLALLRALDDGMASRLHYRLCDQAGLAYSVNAGIEPLGDISLIDLVANAQVGKAPALVARTLEIFDELRRQPIDDRELAKIKARYRYDLASAVDDAAAMAAWFGGMALHYPPPSFDDKVARMEAVTAADIQRVAERVLRAENLAVAVVGDLTRGRLRELEKTITRWS
jgi:predicted Zn-dependent peptidase